MVRAKRAKNFWVLGVSVRYLPYCAREARKKIFCYYGVLQLEKKVATVGYYNFLRGGVLQGY